MMRMYVHAFAYLDVSGAQLRSALGKVGDVASVNSIMDRADVNGDGEISYEEYYRLMNMDKFGDAAVRDLDLAIIGFQYCTCVAFKS